MKIAGALISALAIAWQAATPALAQDAASFYRGKTVRVVVGFSTGGGYDVYARLLARFIGKHIPGNPNVIVQNMPGAASLKSLQFLDQGAPTDGTTIVAFNAGLIMGSLTSPARIPVNFTKLAFIGNIAEDIRVCFTWHGKNIKSWKDFIAREQVVFGSTGAGTSAYIDARMLQLLFGAKLKTVQGYPGSADKKLATESGELDGDCGSWTSLPEDWLRDKKIDIHARFSKTLAPDMPANIPYARDFLDTDEKKQTYGLLVSGAEMGRPFLVSRAVPADRIATLRAAFDAAVKDPELLAEAGKLRLYIAPDPGLEVEKRVAEIYAAPPAVIARAKEIAGD